MNFYGRTRLADKSTTIAIVVLVFSWSGNLQLARVTRWGGMISTPDIVLQGVIKRALLESGCPINLTNDLMENAHERHWPEGLSTLGKHKCRSRPIGHRPHVDESCSSLVVFLVEETRQLNRRHYESYVCRRIVGKQAVVVLSCDNRHMDNLMSETFDGNCRLELRCLVAV
jgi:E3 ubiquitin-protein ligase NRDP1